MQIKTILKFNLTSARLAIINKQITTNADEGAGEKELC
jgi:hypothetical protein